MLKQWLAANRSLVVVATGGTLVAALVATIAIVSTGYTAQKVTLDDGSVWVANGVSQVIGRANPQVLELNTVVASTGSEIDVVQRGSTVLLFDRTNAKVDLVDAATSKTLDTVPLPPQNPELFLAGENVVIGSGTGQFWIVSLAELSHFDAQSPPTLSLGADAVGSVTPDGELFVYSASAHRVYRVDAAHSDAVDATVAARFAGSHRNEVSITSVGGHWVLLDPVERTLLTDRGMIDLADRIPAGGAPVLQQASSSGDSVLVGYSGGLLDVPLGGNGIASLSRGHSGAAVAPAVIGGCSYAAWSDGTAWRLCSGSAAASLSLDSVPAGAARLSFVANGGTVVLNDPRSGGTWAVQQRGEYIDNWSDLITVRTDKQQVRDDSQDNPPQFEKNQLPPVAVDDSFGARPGRASVLPVLLNDYDPNGDALLVSGFTTIDKNVGHLDPINNGQQLQLTLTQAASGSVSFGYTITDGRGGTASASVTVAVRLPSENSPPVQLRQSKSLVAQGGRVTTSVLGDWVDPDGDAFYLESASTAAPDSVSYKPEGSVAFAEGGATSPLRSVALVVSDGRAVGAGSLAVTVKPRGQVPIIADSFVVLSYAGQEITISPLDHVRGGTGTLRLSSVPAKTGATITPSLQAGTFTFSSAQAGTHYLDYVVNDGDQTATGQVRVEVAAQPDANSKPITIPKTVFVKTLGSKTIDVASTDIDPAGGVLLVTGVFNVAANAGVRAEVIENRAIRVTMTAPLESGPVSFNYRITNGLAAADGVVTVVQIPPPPHLQPPVANDDSVTVRVGNVIDIPVLNNDVQPDGETLTLNPLLSTGLKNGSGLLFASGDVLRYLAPQKPGDFTAIYQVAGPDGQVAQAQVKIAVREAEEATNNPPVPATVTGRVLAGATVRIAIPLAGIDPDGDSVQLLGQGTSPLKGSVTDVGPDYVDYQAGDYSAGTDSFSYTVIDSLGARATGIVRVGISPKIDGARNPVAVEDEATMRPGGTVSVQVLANDSDPDGGTLKIVKVQPNTKDVTATIEGDVVTVTPPKSPGRYGLVYTIENSFGGRSSNFITVTVSADAPRAHPLVSDTVLTLTDILGQDTLTVNVLRNAFFADGPVSTLGVALLPGYSDGASVSANKRIRVHVEAKSQIIPFVVSNPDDPSIVSYAFVWVPGLDDALPQLNRKAPPLTVQSESELRIDLNDHVLAVGGKTVHITDTAKVQATHANGDSLVLGDHTLRFTSADKYFGPASISFEVTDGTSATDPNGRVATLVLPIKVTPRQNQPPSFIGGVIDFEPGQSREIDLSKLTNYPYPKDLNELAYTVLGPLPTDFSYTLTGQKLVLRANEDARKNTSTAMLLSVRDALAVGQSGRIRLNVVASSRPLASPALDSVAVRRGQSTTVDVLANDQATNPFPGQPLKVVAIRGLDGASLPAGVSVTPSADNSRLTVVVAADAAASNASLQYEVADATNDPDRYVWGTVAFAVQDRPDPVTAVTATGFGDRTITLRWTPGPANNSPITGYDVLEYDSGSSALLSTTSCDATVCDIATPGNGQSNAVRLRVVATNAIGSSSPAGLGSSIWSDLIPAAPADLVADPLDGGLRIHWTPVGAPSGGSAVQDYLVTAGGISADVDPSSCGATCSVDIRGFSNGQSVQVTASAHNGAYAALANWNTATTAGTPAGPPIAVAAPSATATDSTVTVDWAGAFNDNGSAITKYYASIYTWSAPSCSNLNPAGSDTVDAGTATSAAFPVSSGSAYSVRVVAFNDPPGPGGPNCTAGPATVVHTVPGVITAATTSGPARHGNVWDDVLDSARIGGTGLGSDYSVYYRLSSGSRAEHGLIPIGGFLAAESTQFGQSATVQLRACKSFDGGAPICQSAWSAGFPVATPVNPQVSGVRFTPSGGGLGSDGTFSWLSWPSGSGYENIQYACGNGRGDTFHDADTTVTGGSCDVSGGLGAGPILTIRVVANGGQNYDIQYDQNGTVQ